VATALTSAGIAAWYGIPHARKLHEAYQDELAALEAQKEDRQAEAPKVLYTFEARIRNLATRSSFGWKGRFKEGYDPLAKLESEINKSAPINDDPQQSSVMIRNQQTRKLFDSIAAAQHNEDFLGSRAVVNDEAKYIAVLSVEAPGNEMTIIQVLDLDQNETKGDSLIFPVTQYTCRGGRTRDLDLWEIVRTYISSVDDGMYPIDGNRDLTGMKIFSFDDAVSRGGILLPYFSKPIKDNERYLPKIMLAFYAEAIQREVNKPAPDGSIKVYDGDITTEEGPQHVMIWAPAESDSAYQYLKVRAYSKDALRENGNDHRETQFSAYVGTKVSHFDAFRSGIAHAPPGKFTNSPVRYFFPAGGHARGFDEGRLEATKVFRTIIRESNLS
jgi:hypothetical protein